MISQGTLTVVLWGAYAWFVVGVVMIAVPERVVEPSFQKIG